MSPRIRWIALFAAVLLAPLAGRAQDHDKDRDAVILLPPFDVEENRGPAWRYTKVANTEMLFRGPESIATETVDRYFRLMRMLRLVLPDSPAGDVPVTLMVEDSNYQPVVSAELARAAAQRIEQVAGQGAAQFMPNYHFYDADTEVIYFVLGMFRENGAMFTLSQSYVRFVLESNVPAYPRWFIEGMSGLQSSMVMPVPSVGRDVPVSLGASYTIKPSQPYDEISFVPFVWGDAKQTAELHKMAKWAARTTGHVMLPEAFQMLPMQVVLGLAEFPERDDPRFELAGRQASLFLRWLCDPNPPTPAADALLRSGPKPTLKNLGDYFRRGRAEGFSEELFAECFKWSVADVDIILRSYLPFACLDSSRFRLVTDTEPQFISSISSHEASTRDVARLRGRMNRLSIGYLREFYPQLVSDYVAQARRTMHRAYDEGDRDPRLLAELGLCEVDAGNDDDALPLLMAAAQANVIHPRVYFECARIQFERLRKSDPNMLLSTPEALQIATRLQTGLQQAPPLPQAYELLFEIWLRCQTKLSADQASVVERGSELFPGRFRVCYAAMLLELAAGKVDAAIRIGQRSLTWLTVTTEREKMNRLLSDIEPAR